MVLYKGNVVPYGRSGTWYIQQNVTHTVAPGGASATIKVVMQIYVQYSVNDKYNTFDTTIGTKTWRAKNIVLKSSVGKTYTIGEYTSVHTLKYGATTPVAIKGVGDAIAGGDTGASRINVTYSLPARPGGIPSTPAAPTVTQIKQSSAQVNIKLPNNNGGTITSTRFFIYTAASGGSAFKSHTSSSPVGTSAVLTGLSPSTDYWAAVGATNSFGNSALSPRTKFRTSAVTAPAAPTDVTVTDITETTANIGWTAPAPPAGGMPILGYRVQVLEPALGGASIVYDSNVPDTSEVATSLPPGSTLVARVQARASSGVSLWSGEKVFTTPSTLTPKRPPTPIVRFITATKAWVEIRHVTAPKPPVEGYEAELSVDGVRTIVPTATGLFEFTELTSGEIYGLRVRALSSAGAGSWSNEVTFRTFTGISVHSEGDWPNTDIFLNVETNWRPVMMWYLVGNVWYCPALGISRPLGEGGLYVVNLSEDISEVRGTAVTDTGHGTLIINSPGATIVSTATVQLEDYHG